MSQSSIDEIYIAAGSLRDGCDCECIQTIEAEMQRKLNEPVTQYRLERCIYRVPKLLRQTNEEAYTPTLISIGPYHNHQSQSEADKTMAGLKLNYLKSFVNVPRNHTPVPLLNYISIVKRYETSIHLSYDHPATREYDYDNNKFVEMVLTDSAFLIELFRKGIQDIADNDLIWANPSLKHEVFRDILLMENQLPFFILKGLLNEQGVNDQEIGDLVQKFLEQNYGIQIINPPAKLVDIPHLLDLVRMHYVEALNLLTAANPATTNQAAQQSDNCWSSCVRVCIKKKEKAQVFPKATKLVGANVKFKVGESLKFDYNGRTLTLPKIAVGHQTECLYKNLIAYERCHYPNEPHFTSYICFMNRLIDTPEDIQVLVKAGVIESLWRSKDLSKMLNSLCKNVGINENAYQYEFQTQLINTFYSKKCNHYMGDLYRKYSTPWTIFSLLVAIWFFAAETIQAVTALLDLHKG